MTFFLGVRILGALMFYLYTYLSYKFLFAFTNQIFAAADRTSMKVHLFGQMSAKYFWIVFSAFYRQGIWITILIFFVKNYICHKVDYSNLTVRKSIRLNGYK